MNEIHKERGLRFAPRTEGLVSELLKKIRRNYG